MIIRFSGLGGQGIVMCGIIYGEAAMKQGQNVLQSQAYGSTTRGGTTRSDVIISDKPINDLQPKEIDILVAMSPDAYNKFIKLVKKDGIVIIDNEMIKMPDISDRAFYKIPSTKLAIDKFNKPIMANIIMMGFVAQHVSIVRSDLLKETVSRRVPSKMLELNMQAYDLGLNYKSN